MQEIILLNSFTNSKEGGNGAGLVLSLNFAQDEMKKIASKVGFSETAFMEKISQNEFNIRYFTPNGEVDLCGHATIAAFSYLKNKNLVKKGNYKLSTKAGKIDITVNDIVTMTQNLPKYLNIIEKDEILPCFDNITLNDFIFNAPVQIVSTGLADILVPIKNINTLFKLKPNFNEIKKLSQKYNTIGMHIFTLETLNNSTAHTRNFAPLYLINEESATGTANGALSCYLFKYFNKNFDFKNLTFEQGYCMQKPSKIYASLDYSNEITKVSVGGNAVILDVITI